MMSNAVRPSSNPQRGQNRAPDVRQNNRAVSYRTFASACVSLSVNLQNAGNRHVSLSQLARLRGCRHPEVS